MKIKTQWILGSAILIAALLLGGYQAVRAHQTPAPTIVSFTSVLRAVTVAEAESFAREATLKWRTSGMTADYHLTLHEYQQHNWVAVPDAASALFAENGERMVTVKHPQNFGPPMFLLSIVDPQGRVIDQRTVVLRYDLPPEPPTIEAFTASASAVNVQALAAGNMTVELDWTIRNRPPTANPLFTQVFDDGSAVLVELPRPNPWIPSVWHGPVKPVWRNGLAAIRLRMELVDQVSGGIYTQAEVVLPIVSYPVPPAVPSPTIVEPPNEEPGEVNEIAGPEIIAFTVTPDNVALGSTVTFAWEVRGTTGIVIEQMTPSSMEKWIPVVESNLLQGTANFELPWLNTDVIEFGLRTIDGGAAAQVAVHTYCDDSFFFGASADCPSGPAYQVAGAYQAFEDGFMLWRGDTRQIYVFSELGDYGPPSFDVYEVDYDGMPDSDPNKVPPPGLYAPANGFGRLWTNDLAVAAELGWALAPEQGYTMTLQEAGESYIVSSTPSPQFTVYLSLPDGRVVGFRPWYPWRFVP